jgi:hypothetical protein
MFDEKLSWQVREGLENDTDLVELGPGVGGRQDWLRIMCNTERRYYWSWSSGLGSHRVIY